MPISFGPIRLMKPRATRGSVNQSFERTQGIRRSLSEDALTGVSMMEDTEYLLNDLVQFHADYDPC
jgi:hypothetical protein